MTEERATREPEARSIDLEVTVAGSPEQVWAAIATSSGVSAWMQPTQIEPRPGGAYSFDLLDGAGPNATGSVGDYDPPQHFATTGVQWTAAGAEQPALLATEWTVRALDGSACVVRMVMSGFGAGQGWDDEIEAMAAALRRSLTKLATYLGRAQPVPADDARPAGGLSNCTVGPVIPVGNLDTSIAFYQHTLGLRGEPAPSGYKLIAADGSVAYLLTGTDYAGKAGWPLASFAAHNLDRVVDDLAERGVATSKEVPYDTDQRGIADLDGMRIAWFTDPDHQVISVFELTSTT